MVLVGTALWTTQLHSVEFKLDEQEAVNLGLRLLDAHPWSSNAPWPALPPTTSPSQSPSSMKEMTVLPMSFMVEPWPISPQ
jgi:hypothetical protein